MFQKYNTFNISHNLKWITNFDGSKKLILNIISFKFTIWIMKFVFCFLHAVMSHY